MDDLRDTLMAYGCIAIRAGDFNGLNDFLEQECGTRLHVAWPERCFIQLRSRSALGPFVGKMGTVCSQGAYVCCQEYLHPFGFVEGPGFMRYQLIVLIGQRGGIYCYDDLRDCVYELAATMKDFLRHGFRHCDHFHTMRDYQRPMVQYDDYWNAVMLYRGDVESLSAEVTKRGYASYTIDDPFDECPDTHFAFWTHNTEVMKFKETSFSVVRAGGSIQTMELMIRTVPRITCYHQLLGALGHEVPERKEFLVRQYVLVDTFGVVYGYDPAMDAVYRLAEDVVMFTCVMGKKGHRNHRFSSRREAIVRLEKTPTCQHPKKNPDPMIMFDEDDDDELSLPRNVMTHEEAESRLYDAITENLMHCVKLVTTDSPLATHLWPQELQALCDSPALSLCTDDVEGVRQKLRARTGSLHHLELSYRFHDEDPETYMGFLWDIPSCDRCVRRRRFKVCDAGRRHIIPGAANGMPPLTPPHAYMNN
ncbi:tegument protein vICA [Human betaherpesvirus 5]|nr:tegument protein vICA [Human betaherpesvirus 5]